MIQSYLQILKWMIFAMECNLIVNKEIQKSFQVFQKDFGWCVEGYRGKRFSFGDKASNTTFIAGIGYITLHCCLCCSFTSYSGPIFCMQLKLSHTEYNHENIYISPLTSWVSPGAILCIKNSFAKDSGILSFTKTPHFVNFIVEHCWIFTYSIWKNKLKQVLLLLLSVHSSISV